MQRYHGNHGINQGAELPVLATSEFRRHDIRTCDRNAWRVGDLQPAPKHYQFLDVALQHRKIVFDQAPHRHRDAGRSSDAFNAGPVAG